MRRYLQAEFYKLAHRNYARAILLAAPVLVICYLAMMVSQRSHGAASWTFHGVMSLSVSLLPWVFWPPSSCATWCSPGSTAGGR